MRILKIGGYIMRMLLIGVGGVGESIVKILKERDPDRKWLEQVVCADYNLERAKEVVEKLGDRSV